MNTTQTHGSPHCDLKWALKHLGAQWKPDYNCWDFTKHILLQELGVDASSAFEAVQNPLHVDEAGQAIVNGLLDGWQQVTNPSSLCLCVVGKGSVPHHIGVIVGESHLIHLNRGMPSCCTPLSVIREKYRTIRFYQYAKSNPS